MGYFIGEFAKKESDNNKKTNRLLGGAQVATGGLLLHEGYKQGFPRALGVRLESHSTGRKEARDIMKQGGYLDPNQMGKTTGKAMDGIYDKNQKYTFITGAHPSKVREAKGLDRIVAPLLRMNYRTTGGMSSSARTYALQRGNLKNIANNRKMGNVYNDNQIKQLNGLYGTNYKNSEELYDDLNNLVRKFPSNKKLDKEMSNAFLLNKLKGKSLYTGGSDDYFRKNFTPDEDMPTLAMKSSGRVKVARTRGGAVYDAIKREGLVNLIKKSPKSRIALGATVLGTTGLGGGYLIKKGVDNLRNKNKKR